MRDFVGSSIALAAGTKLKLTVVIDVGMSQGKFALKGKHALSGDQVLLNGFAVKYPEVGKISENVDTEDESGGESGGKSKGTIVQYEHLKAEKNIIWFFALTGEIGVVNIISTPIHDHSSVVQGGPAYGTYFSEYT